MTLNRKNRKMSNVTLYTKTDCPNCNIAKVKLYRSGIEHTVVDITNEDITRFKAEYNKQVRSMPVIEVTGDTVYTYEQLDTVIGKQLEA